MSRIGNKPVVIPKGVDVKVGGGEVRVKGPKGELAQALTGGVTAEVKDGKIVFKRAGDGRPERALHGLYRSLINNMVIGVTQGFLRELEVHGVGYRAEAKNNILELQIGFTHAVEFHPPAGVTVSAKQEGRGGIFVITVTGTDKQKVGAAAAQIRGIRRPEPYKQKGIRYRGEEVRKLMGKAFAAGAAGG
jgi:large subunit ribosomal protein L6